uniref:Terpene synthase n=1 Tax=Woodsia scopulina TaxID=1498956 RepID=A0A1J0CQA2_9MONI|nr:terpene synthase 1 [Woodsia scopulina]
MAGPAPACSFKRLQHPEYEAMKAECEPWLLALAAPPSAAAVRFWQDSSLPLLGSFFFAQCSKKRAVLGTKMLSWFTVSDTADDDLSVRGSAVAEHVDRRHDLILACFAGKPLDHHTLAQLPGGADISREFSSLQEIWKGISEDMPLAMQARYRDAVSRYLHALRVQAQYRNAHSLPGVDEYLNVVRRPASIVLQLLVLLEYGLGIELDEATLGSELLLRLQDAVVGHIALYNDLFSYEAEMCGGDYFNLPSVILRESRAAQPGFTLADAVEETVRMVEEVDKQCAELMEEVEKSRLMEKAGVERYLRGLGTFMAGNAEWSSKTGRYTHTCSSEGVVLPVVRMRRTSSLLLLPASPRPYLGPTSLMHVMITPEHRFVPGFITLSDTHKRVSLHAPKFNRVSLLHSSRLHTSMPLYI